jgi:catechol 2,3-dioxygenase-like lactoylglutathione lyase family enzyme
MPRLRLNHVGLVVADLDGIAAFYERWFGFEVAGSFTFDDDPWMNRIAGTSRARGRAVHLRGANGYIELFRFDEPAMTRPAAEPWARGFTHLGFEVEDLAATHERMATAGVPFLSAPQDPEDGSLAVYGRDPEDNLFELMQLGGESAAFSLDAIGRDLS